MLKIMISLAVVAVAAFADGPVLKTGQTTEYRAGDDGTYMTGIARSYTRDGVNGVVTDNATGLEWQDDAVGSSMNWDAAQTHCAGLSIDGGGWRVPTVEELVSITDKSRVDPSIDPLFQNVTSRSYWSSTIGASDSTAAWTVNFNHGNDGWGSKTVITYVRCVRGGQ